MKTTTDRATQVPELKTGDTVNVWWGSKIDTVKSLSSYAGPDACLSGALVIHFMSGRAIPFMPYERFTVVA